jgi:hypothetical protein
MVSNGFCITLGDAFLIPDNPSNTDKRHLYIAIIPLTGSKYLFVNATTKRPNSDTSCILYPGNEVPDFITRESVIAYQFIREFSTEDINRFIGEGNCSPKGNVSASILLDIQRGGVISKQTKNKYKRLMKEYLQL